MKQEKEDLILLRKKIKDRVLFDFEKSINGMLYQMESLLSALKEYFSQKGFPEKERQSIKTNIEHSFKSKEYKEYFNSSTSEIEKALPDYSTVYRFVKGGGVQSHTLDFYSVCLGYAGAEGYFNDNQITLYDCFEIERNKRLFEKRKYLKYLLPSETNDLNKKSTIQKSSILPKELTIYLPTRRADQLVGRKADIEDIRERLFEKEHVVLLNGMGGIGKTAIASVYATTELKNGKYKHVIWINQTTDNFLSDFVYTPELLENFNIAEEDKTFEKLYQELVGNLKKIENTPCLMVIDNATEELAKYYDTLPIKSGWHILITSREKIPFFDEKEIGFLTEEQTVELFEVHYKRKDISRKDIKKIVKNVDFHTLTIEILAKTAHHNKVSPNKILKAIEKDIETNIRIRHSTDKIEKITSYLQSIFSFNNLSEKEKWLLANISCLPSEHHPYERIKSLILPSKKKENNIGMRFSNLTNEGWLLCDEKKDSYKLHRILVEVVYRSIGVTEEVVSFLLSVLTKSLEIKPSLKYLPKDKFVLIPFGKSALNQLRGKASLKISELQNNLGLIIRDLGGVKNLKDAKELLLKAKNADEKLLGENDPLMVTRYSNFATVLQCQGGEKNFLEAMRWFEKGKTSAETNFGSTHPTTATLYSNIANLLQDLGGINNLYKAKKLLAKAKDIEEVSLGEMHPSTITRYSNLATLLQDIGGKENLLEAKELLIKATRADENVLGSNHPKTIIRYNNLAIVLKDLGGKDNLEKAKELLIKVKDADEENYGKDHPIMAERYSNLAIVLRELGGQENLENAKKWLLLAKCNSERNYGKMHPKTSIRYTNLANIFQDLGGERNLKEALKLFVLAKNANEKNFGSMHPRIAANYNSLALVFQDFGDEKNLQEARKWIEKALIIYEKKFGCYHPETTNCYSNLSIILQDLGGKDNLLQAKELLIKAKDADEKNFGEDHPRTTIRYSNLAGILQDLGGNKNLENAKRLLIKAKKADEKNYGINHFRTAIRYSNLALLLANLGGEKNLVDAEKLIIKAKNIASQVLSDKHPQITIISKNFEYILLKRFISKEKS